MSIRNDLLKLIYEAYGGTPSEGQSRNDILSGILTELGGDPSGITPRNELLFSIATRLGAVSASPSIRNEILRDIVSAVGGDSTKKTRNELLQQWLGGAGLLITEQPVTPMLSYGDIANFSISAVGNGAISYQWYLNGIPEAGETNSTYSISTTLVSNFSTVYCVVSDSVSSQQSETALITWPLD